VKKLDLILFRKDLDSSDGVVTIMVLVVLRVSSEQIAFLLDEIYTSFHLVDDSHNRTVPEERFPETLFRRFQIFTRISYHCKFP